MTAPQLIADPHGLLRSDEPLASTTELAAMLGCSGRALRALLGGPLHGRTRFVHYRPGPARYCVADVRSAFETYRAEVEARQRRAADREALERAAADARRARSAHTASGARR
jgi:hypothetical protein